MISDVYILTSYARIYSYTRCASVKGVRLCIGCVGCENVLYILWHDIGCVYSHTLHTCIFSHPTHNDANEPLKKKSRAHDAQVCRVGERLPCSTV